MFCPNCHGEYREGITTCTHCGVSLVAELEPAPDQNLSDLVAVLSTPDEATILFARSLLDDAGISYFVRNDQLQDWIGLGRVGGYNIVVGPMVIQVAEDDAEAAIAILRDAELAQAREAESEEPED
jgi:hypothetical protein